MKFKKASKIIFLCFALICSMSAPFSSYAYDWSSTSSPVNVNDFYYNFNMARCSSAFMIVENNDMRINATNASSAYWLWNGLNGEINRTNNNVMATGLFQNPSVTLTPGYRYICSVTVQVRRDFNDLTNLFKGFTSDFYLYSSTYPGNYSRLISPSSYNLTNSDRLQAIYEFDFNPESMFVDYDSNEVDGFGFNILFNEFPANDSASISSLRIVGGNFKCLVFSPEDYETLKITEGITKMDQETFDRIYSKFESAESSKQEAVDEVLDLLPDTSDVTIDYPDLASTYKGALVVGNWMQEFFDEVSFVRALVLTSFSVSILFLIGRITHV